MEVESRARGTTHERLLERRLLLLLSLPQYRTRIAMLVRVVCHPGPAKTGAAIYTCL